LEENMLTKKMVCSFAAVGLIVMTAAGAAWARSVLAASGHARLGSQAACFNINFTTGAVDSTCNADFIVPLPTDTAGVKPVTFTARATSPGAVCRTVSNNRFGTAMSASAFVPPISIGPNYVVHAIPGIFVPSPGVFFADCITNPGTSLLLFDYPA
jgi:hypothetical protein